ncbi:Putative galactose oxidase/kelch, beta-propeller, kelch-type beta propeller [Septoria linicola]|uniref:Galactose oxidase/kelch, beta-propeller, kelch-type beta propeller n=1 Tax=Septoria linicola TaxID=215465 RepID=A0A9Q9EQ05_9PEZI|nr:putative galactose oxidase/kelch, beta-propeller, kelch-type beta propeller [Septoria linicola]USW58620.1 Putative galactose oxidase/kelch, beta-propeller, kelch-type beta propeller [Septoria linicola]
MKDQLVPWSLLALVRIALADVSLPYNPTTVLTSPNSSIAYILRGSLGNSNQAVLESVDVSGEFDSDKLSRKTLSPALPFLEEDTLVPYLPILDASGNITVVAGDCKGGSDSTAVWKYNGQWTKHDSSATQLSVNGNLTGVNYLSNGIAFSADMGDGKQQLDLYVFGGMCPSSNSTTATWQGSAEYSQTMLVYTPSGGASTGKTVYDIGNTAARGPPIAEAGFSMTGLTPTFRVNATGAAHSQQQDFLLLGGHTTDAFLNTSQVALFSLPQNSWSFLPVQQPSTGRIDLAVREAEVSTVEPRSGHTAVLSEDGSKIIVIGGWVGDISNPAVPQLAVLNLGSEYGGDAAEAWTWTVPSQSGSGIAEGTGLFGHGAAMLPGGVVMIVGGYTIPAASSSRFVRRQAQPSDQVLLFNATSNQWLDSYTNPLSSGQSSESSSGGGALSKTSQQTGLGLGLGLGVLVLVILILAYFWYARRLKKKREERQQALLHSADGSFMALDQPYLDHGNPHDRRNGPYAAVDDGSQPMQQAASTGLFVSVPSPTRGLRNGLLNRPYSYHQTARNDDTRINKGSGNIHPILERQDEDDLEGSMTPRDPFLDPSPTLEPGQVRDRFSTAEAKLQELQRVLHSGADTSPTRDPFNDPVPNPLGSHPTSPRSPNAADTLRRVPTYMAREQVIERKPVPSGKDMNWEVIEHDDDITSGSSSGHSTGPASWSGRISPTKTDDRTSSTLSDRSTRSHASTTSITRTMSTRTGALMAAALARREAENTPGTSPLETRTGTMTTTGSSSGRKSPYYFYGSHTESQRKVKRESKKPVLEPIHNADESTESFMTANSSFIGLQQEGKALLGGSPTFARDDPYHRALAAHGLGGTNSRSEADPAGPSRRQGWMGSIRRALTTAMNDRSFSLTSQNKQPPEEIEPRTSSSSPSRSHRPAGTSDKPRRAISDGGALLKQKRGQKDWDAMHPYRDDPELEGDWGEETRTSLDAREAENEWDVEGAASKRDFQVMFTVPKARLRVVNADIERASMRSASDGAISRKESMLSLNNNKLTVGKLSREGSVNTVRSRSGGDVEIKERESQMEMRMRGLLSSGSRIEDRNKWKPL